MRYALIDRNKKVVVNIIELDPASLDYSGPADDAPSLYTPPDGYMVIATDIGQKGDAYMDGIFVPQ